MLSTNFFGRTKIGRGILLTLILFKKTYVFLLIIEIQLQRCLHFDDLIKKIKLSYYFTSRSKTFSGILL